MSVGFVRRPAHCWRRDVPGARWFKADLDVHTVDDPPARTVDDPPVRTVDDPPVRTVDDPPAHTVDDAPGGNVTLLDGFADANRSGDRLAVYARRFLQAAIENCVQVLGVTPHCPRYADRGYRGRDLSAAWRIVEEWNSGTDDDGIPYREKVYAVFPGFKPLLDDGRGGLHLCFLFDPEIGRSRYLELFDLILNGKPAWNGDEVGMAGRGYAEVFDLLNNSRSRDRRAHDADEWDFLVLAPDILGQRGLLGTPGEQVQRDTFEAGSLAGLELPHDSLPEDILLTRSHVKEFLSRNRLPYFHSSAAHSLQDIGKRHVWVKLASPTVEALRQAFIAHDTRIRIAHEVADEVAHEVDDEGSLRDLKHPPDATRRDQSWLKSIEVKGKASFFGVREGESPTKFTFSPDLTCIIGGSMTGKSTLLDGLRVYVGARLPHDPQARRQVEQRAKERFLAGSAQIELDYPGSDPTAQAQQRWPAVFYTQGELQRLAQDSTAIERILSRFDELETAGIDHRYSDLAAKDRELERLVDQIAEVSDKLDEAEQALTRSTRASDELLAFSDAGVDDLNRATGSASTWHGIQKSMAEMLGMADELSTSLNSMSLPDIDSADGTNPQILAALWQDVLGTAQTLVGRLTEARQTSRRISESHEARRMELAVRVDRSLADKGYDGARINELQALNAQASLQASYRSNHDSMLQRMAHLEAELERNLQERRRSIEQQRLAFDRIIASINEKFKGRIIAQRFDSANSEPLKKFLVNLRQSGITRWWNDCRQHEDLSPEKLRRLLENDDLASVGMSDAVQRTLRRVMTPQKLRELSVLRCRDGYSLQFSSDGSTYRPLEKLSGGQRVNILLSLLLEADDDRPLVVDQPEDELDNRFLFDTLLPALRGLKGRRQVIIATHNANIVVNGDADQVIQLTAAADHGRIAHSGAIEDSTVRDAIVQTVDGGAEAFDLRRRKYGF